jgi:RNA polymerase sigma factor (TIGR02999 family)
MVESRQDTVTRLLAQVREGRSGAFDELFPLVYEEIHTLARGQRRRWEGDETLNTTALVHEAYLRLVDQTSPAWRNRAHFLAVAARAMRHVLIDHARIRQAQKRGGKRRRLSLGEIEETLAGKGDPARARDEALVALETSLASLEAENERQSRIVECRFFAGMTIRETAEALGVSHATVERDWAAAQVWLYRDLKRRLGAEG